MIAWKALSPSPFKQLASRPSIPVSYFSSSSRFERWRQPEKNSGVVVWWDIDNCPAPEGTNLSKVPQAIEAAVRANGISGSVEISAVADLYRRPRRIWKTLHDSGITMTHVPTPLGRRDSYLPIIGDLMKLVYRNPPPAHLFLITDRDFSERVNLLSKRYNVLVATNEASDAVLCSDASIVWCWNDLVKGEKLKSIKQPLKSHSSLWDVLSLLGGSEQKMNTHEKQVQDPFFDSLEVHNDKHGGEAELPGWKLASQAIIGWSNLKANQSIKHVVEVVTEVEKYNRLVKLLHKLMDGSRILIFTATKEGCDRILRKLTMECWPTSSILEDRNQAELKYDGSTTMTEVADGGNDVEDVKHVINYDCPTGLEAYIHRIGRAGDKGTAFTFVDHADAKFAGQLVKILGDAPPPLSDPARSAPSFGGNSNPEDEEAMLIWQPVQLA